MRTELSEFESSISDILFVLRNFEIEATRDPLDLDANRRRSISQSALIVVMSGYFEEFLKRVARAFIEKVGQRSIGFHNLPGAMKQAHLEAGGRILNRRALNRATWVAADPEDIAFRIGDAIRNPSGGLLWEAFADTKGNPNSNVIVSFLESLGIKKAKEKLGTAAGKPWDQIQISLDLFIESRNQCAHTGTTTSNPSTSTIINYCDELKQLASALVKVLNDHLTAISPRLSLSHSQV